MTWRAHRWTEPSAVGVLLRRGNGRQPLRAHRQGASRTCRRSGIGHPHGPLHVIDGRPDAQRHPSTPRDAFEVRPAAVRRTRPHRSSRRHTKVVARRHHRPVPTTPAGPRTRRSTADGQDVQTATDIPKSRGLADSNIRKRHLVIGRRQGGLRRNSASRLTTWCWRRSQGRCGIFFFVTTAELTDRCYRMSRSAPIGPPTASAAMSSAASPCDYRCTSMTHVSGCA